MNVLIKGRCNNYDSWREVFDGHKARAEVCDCLLYTSPSPRD